MRSRGGLYRAIWRTLCILGVCVLAFLMGSSRIALADPGDPGTGPGGVGNSLTGNLRLWLMGDKGVYSNSQCSLLQATSGGEVGCWKDQSGFGSHVVQSVSASRPTYQGDQALNGIPVIQFGSGKFLERTGLNDLNQSFTLFAVSVAGASPAQNESVFSNRRAATANAFQLGVGGAGGCSGQYQLNYAGGSLVCSGAHIPAAQILTLRVDSAAPPVVWNNGASYAGTQGLVPNFDRYRVGSGFSNVSWSNDIAEVILYHASLKEVFRILVENYLQAKYNDSLVNNLTIAEDKYDGDTTENGDFDLNVAGIGREAAGANDVAHSAGMIVQDGVPAYLRNEGDYLMFGHKDPVNFTTRADLPSGWPTANPARWGRHWYVDLTDIHKPAGMVDIAFDISEGGFTELCSVANASYYRLLKRQFDYGAFAEVPVSATCLGDVVTFAGVSVDYLGSNFTIGTLNNTEAPLGPDAPTAVTMAGLDVRAQADGLRVEWATALELDVYGFDVYRSTGPFDAPDKLNDELIPSKALGGLGGAAYVYLDRTAQPGTTYYYWIEVQQIEGPARYGPQAATMTYWRYLPVIRR